jgi:restriction system protein
MERFNVFVTQILSNFQSTINFIVELSGLNLLYVYLILGLMGLLLIPALFHRNGRKSFRFKFIPWRRLYAKKWLANFRKSKAKFSIPQRFKYLRDIEHFLFEEILLTTFEQRGYKVIRTKMTRDNGSDGYVFINGKKIVIQAKRYSGQIKRSAVIEFESLIQSEKDVAAGLFIHTGKTSGPVLKMFHDSQDMVLLSGLQRVISFIDGGDITIFSQPLKTI